MTEHGEYWRSLVEDLNRISESLKEEEMKIRKWRHCLTLIEATEKLGSNLGPNPGSLLRMIIAALETLEDNRVEEVISDLMAFLGILTGELP
jgi:hypothetical protein